MPEEIMEMRNHWETVYGQKCPEGVSWYKPHLELSLELLERAGLNPDSHVIDVGGGASTLSDDLLSRGVKNVTVLDVSSQALAASKSRLGHRASEVNWMEADITQAKLPENAYDIWHDRAVFHFLTKADDRCCYVNMMKASLKPTGQIIMATFNLQGPPRCSGLDVIRYSPDTLQTELGKDFRLIEAVDEEHRTPSDIIQKFVYCRFQRI